jgi:hypothetical protein
MLTQMKAFKLNRFQKTTWILLMVVIGSDVSAQTSTKPVEVTEQHYIMTAEADTLKPAPKVIKKLGDYTVKEVDGIKIVYDRTGVPLLVRAEDFERIYLEEVSKKKSE